MTEVILPVIRLQPSNKIMIIKCICNKEYTFREKKYFLITRNTRVFFKKIHSTSGLNLTTKNIFKNVLKRERN